MPVPDALRGEMVKLRPAAMTDAARLTEILAHPDVEAWWGPHDLAAVQAKVSGQEDGSVPFAIEADGEVIGLIQYSEENTPTTGTPASTSSCTPIGMGEGWERTRYGRLPGTSSTSAGTTGSRSTLRRTTSARSAPTSGSASARSG